MGRNSDSRFSIIKVILLQIKHLLLKILVLLFLVLKAQGEKSKMKENNFVVSKFIGHHTSTSSECCYLSSQVRTRQTTFQEQNMDGKL